MVRIECSTCSDFLHALFGNDHKGDGEMEFSAKDKAFEAVTETEGSQQVGDCTRFSQGRFLDELPGAAFVVITLIWIIASFSHLIW